MIIRSAFTLSLLLVLTVGCTATAPVVDSAVKQITVTASVLPTHDTAIHKIIREPIRVTKCRRTQRNLTKDWQSREYLCSHEHHISSLQDHNAAFFYGHSRKYKSLSVSKVGNDKRTASPIEDKILLPVVVRDDTLNSDNVPECAKSVPLEPIKQSPVHIHFARNREVLGPKGTEKSLLLIPAVKEAHRVTLRGIYEHTEITDPTPLNQERFSVGRALSVRKLWSEHGVDPAKVSILHHRTDLSGRYVEVILHDR